MLRQVAERNEGTLIKKEHGLEQGNTGRKRGRLVKVLQPGGKNQKWEQKTSRL